MRIRQEDNKLLAPKLPRATRRLNSHGSLRAALIRGNASRFEERYEGVTAEDLVAEGAFGRVHACRDLLSRTQRAVKQVPLPEGQELRDALSSEVACLVSLDHPHIVRLIEYFVEDDTLFMVMEMLHGPCLTDKMAEVGKFEERFAARCARHIMKALFCCHCNGIAHNDVTPENFKFDTDGDHWNLKMVDFGLSEVFSEDKCLSPLFKVDRGTFAQERDVWGAGVILYQLLSGEPLYQQGRGSDGLRQLTDQLYVPRKIAELEASNEARDLLHGMLELSTAARSTARDCLLHPFITRFYAADDNDLPRTERIRSQMQHWLSAMRSFHNAPRLKKLALVVAAHLLTNNNDTIAEIHFLFRFFVRDALLAEEEPIRELFAQHRVELPDDFSEIFGNADIIQEGGLSYVQFVACSLSLEPSIVCKESMLKAMFRFLDYKDQGRLSDESLSILLDMPHCPLVGAGTVEEACGVASATFHDFQELMIPSDWQMVKENADPKPAHWADKPDYGGESSDLSPRYSSSSETEPHFSIVDVPKTPPRLVRTSTRGQMLAGARPTRRCNPVKSIASPPVAVCQRPGFHNAVLRPYYASQHVSNVVMGIVWGTSAYARGCVEANLATLIDVGGDERGAFFLMPNPKYHWDPDELVRNPPKKWRIVAWWIAPEFLDQTRSWVNRAPSSSSSSSSPCSSDSCNSLPELGSIKSVGAPGDFGFSSVRKPPNYLHTYRDLEGPASAEMLQALLTGIRSFLEGLMGSTLSSVPISAGFHYPVRPQYSTLHLQLRVNSGDVCGGEDLRGFDLLKLISRLESNPDCFHNDDEVLHYQATDNLRTALLSAANKAHVTPEEVGPHSLVLSPPHEGGASDENEDTNNDDDDDVKLFGSHREDSIFQGSPFHLTTTLVT